MLKREELPECDVATTVQIIGNKVEAADNAEPSFQVLEIQRAAEIH